MSRHQKRLSSPRNLPIRRKEGTYVIRSKGPHPAAHGLPLAVVLRDVLGYAETLKEVRQVLSAGKVLVDGRVRTDPQFTLGFMDVLSFPDLDEAYRLLLDGDRFVLTAVSDADKKLVRIEDKTTLKEGRTQLNLHDGNNIETDKEYSPRSSLLVTVPDMDIQDEYAFEEGNTAYITRGQHAGRIGTIVEIQEQQGAQPPAVELETDDATVVTVADNVYVIGGSSPEVDVNE